jgi:uncharacterized protein (TIGR00730 family)
MSDPQRAPTEPTREEDPGDIVETAIGNLWAVVNELSRLKLAAPREYRVSIFGSARTRPGDPVYENVKELARQLAARGCGIVTGGGPGLMRAANEGERLGDPENRRHTIGVRVELPFEPEANPFVEQAFMHRTFFSRLHHFVRLSHAFVIVDGGIGTTLEMFMVWQLLQVRHLDSVPLILVGPMWKNLVDWAKGNMLRPDGALASAPDLDLPHCVPTIDAVYPIIEKSMEDFRRRA